MRTASFLLLSAALHAAVLAYPALWIMQGKPTPLAVTIVEYGEEGGGASGGENSAPAEKHVGAAAKRKFSQPSRIIRPAAPADAWRPREVLALAAPAEPIALPVIPNETSGAIEVPARAADPAIALQAASTGGPGNASGSNGGGTSGTGNGASGGSGNGSGAGIGNGSGDGMTRFVQASYAACPKADYPEAARREGWEGTVLIEVAVDEDGRPKSSRVYRSSGFAALDRAALDNIQRRCRFHPARRGERRVETSIKIPVVFRLADAH